MSGSAHGNDLGLDPKKLYEEIYAEKSNKQTEKNSEGLYEMLQLKGNFTSFFFYRF